MKRLSLFITFICLIISSFAQTSNSRMQYDPRIANILSAEEIALYEQQAPAKLWDINYDLTHFGYIDSQIPENNMMMGDICNYVATGKNCNTGEMVGAKKFNYFDFGLTSDPQKYVVYPIGNTGFYVILQPTDEYSRVKSIERKKMGF